VKDPFKAGAALLMIAITADVAWNREKSLIAQFWRYFNA
jgi:hypothetical protein